MKKYIFMAVAAIVALSSCSSDEELTGNNKKGLVFTATMEGSDATRAIYNDTEKCAQWNEGDQISINGKTYSAQPGADLTAKFKAVNEKDEATGETYVAYFPASLSSGTLPAVQTYEAGKFNMPMYATSKTTELQFKNLCAVLAVKVTSAEIHTLKSIKVVSDKKMNGSFTVSDNKAVVGNDGTNVVVLNSPDALPLSDEGTTFYIYIPAQEYEYLNIFLSSNGTTYTKAMATKKKVLSEDVTSGVAVVSNGVGEIARSQMLKIGYKTNAVKLWAGNIFIADCNVGATTPTDNGGYYIFGGHVNKPSDSERGKYKSGENITLEGYDDTAYYLWGSNWRMPTYNELNELIKTSNCTNEWTSQNSVNGLQFKSTTYIDNSVFLPAAGYYTNYPYSVNTYCGYMSSKGAGSWKKYYMYYNSAETNPTLKVDDGNYGRGYCMSVRAVLVEQ